MIRIVYRNGEEERVPPKFLDILLYLGQVQLFMRTDGWVIVGVDRLRDSQPDSYSGTDLRRHKPTLLPAPLQANFEQYNSPQYQ